MSSRMAVILMSAVLTIVLPSAAQETINVRDSIDRIKMCYSADQNDFNHCLMEFWKEVRPMLAAGIPDLKVPKLDPLLIDKMEISENAMIVQGTATFTNLTVTGLSKYVPKRVVADVRAQTITVEIFIPEMSLESDYQVDGTALLLPVRGRGVFRMKLTDVDGKAVAHLEREGMTGGVRLVNTDIDFDIGHIAARLENLLGGQELGDAVNKLINGHAQEILADVKPIIASNLGVGISQVLAGAVNELPGDIFVLPEKFVRR